MSGLQREVVPGACGAPQPGNWRDVCRRRPGHEGKHHAGIEGPYCLAWVGDGYPVRSVRALSDSAYIGVRRRLR